jgi:hypothetical protein
MTATLYIDLTDAEGYATGRTVPVTVDYITIVDKDYGSDADGRQGETRYEREVLDVYIEPEHLLALTSTQVEQVRQEAMEQCDNMKGSRP